MATTGTVLYDFMSQNSVIIVVTGVLATFIAFAAYYVARVYLPSNTHDSTAVNPDVQEKTPDNTGGKSLTSNIEPVSESGDNEKQPSIDPVFYCEHIQGEIKKVKQGVATRKICESLSAEQIAEERKRQQDQLAEIFKLMQQQEDKFGISSMEEMQEQMRLYADLK